MPKTVGETCPISHIHVMERKHGRDNADGGEPLEGALRKRQKDEVR